MTHIPFALWSPLPFHWHVFCLKLGYSFVAEQSISRACGPCSNLMVFWWGCYRIYIVAVGFLFSAEEVLITVPHIIMHWPKQAAQSSQADKSIFAHHRSMQAQYSQQCPTNWLMHDAGHHIMQQHQGWAVWGVLSVNAGKADWCCFMPRRRQPCTAETYTSASFVPVCRSCTNISKV